MPNKTNFEVQKIMLTPLIQRTKNNESRTGEAKNEPNRTQFFQCLSVYSVVDNLCSFVSIRGSKRQKKASFGTSLAYFWTTLASFGRSLASFWTTLATKKHQKTAFSISKTQKTQLQQRGGTSEPDCVSNCPPASYPIYRYYRANENFHLELQP